MKKLIAGLLFAALLAACSSQPTTNGGGGTPSGNGAFNDNTGKDSGETVAEPSIVLDRTDVQRFRGTEMVKLLQTMDSSEPDDWHFVRRHVYPAPEPPYVFDDSGRVKKKNYDWPPEDPKDLSEKQRKWRSFLLWPEVIRDLLLKKDWDSQENRTRLANYGRMYALLQEFQTRAQYPSPTRESEYWKDFAEKMLAYGTDGRDLLMANMIVALSNPLESVTEQAEDILVQIGDPAIEPLCAAMWTSHRQLVTATEEEYDPKLKRRVTKQVYKAFGNPNYNRYIEDTLYRIGPRAVPQAIYELENSLNKDGKSVGPSWRYRKYFVELLGRFGDPKALRTLEAEADRVVVQEYDEKALQDGKQVIDKQSTDTARFTWQEYLIEAIGKLHDPAGLRPIIRLWKQDDFHEVAAIGAIKKLTGKKIASIEAARALAKSLKVDLKGA